MPGCLCISDTVFIRIQYQHDTTHFIVADLKRKAYSITIVVKPVPIITIIHFTLVILFNHHPLRITNRDASGCQKTWLIKHDLGDDITIDITMLFLPKNICRVNFKTIIIMLVVFVIVFTSWYISNESLANLSASSFSYLFIPFFSEMRCLLRITVTSEAFATGLIFVGYGKS